MPLTLSSNNCSKLFSYGLPPCASRSSCVKPFLASFNIASIDRSTGLTPSKNSLNSSNTYVGNSSLNTWVSAGGLAFQFIQLGVRVARAASAVTLTSIFNPLSKQNFLNVSAYSFHCSISMSLSKAHHAHIPRPESNLIGSGNSVLARKSFSASSASCLDLYFLPSISLGSTSKSINKDLEYTASFLPRFQPLYVL